VLARGAGESVIEDSGRGGWVRAGELDAAPGPEDAVDGFALVHAVTSANPATLGLSSSALLREGHGRPGFRLIRHPGAARVCHK
jgi:hypothetical protein